MLFSFLAACLISLIIALISYFFNTPHSQAGAYRLAADSVGISGVLMACFYFLSLIASKGTFDILSYAIIASLRSVFDYKRWKDDPNRDYYHYKMKKDSQERKPLLAILFVSVIFITAGLLLLIPYSMAM